MKQHELSTILSNRFEAQFRAFETKRAKYASEVAKRGEELNSDLASLRTAFGDVAVRMRLGKLRLRQGIVSVRQLFNAAINSAGPAKKSAAAPKRDHPLTMREATKAAKYAKKVFAKKAAEAAPAETKLRTNHHRARKIRNAVSFSELAYLIADFANGLQKDQQFTVKDIGAALKQKKVRFNPDHTWVIINRLLTNIKKVGAKNRINFYAVTGEVKVVEGRRKALSVTKQTTKATPTETPSASAKKARRKGKKVRGALKFSELRSRVADIINGTMDGKSFNVADIRSLLKLQKVKFRDNTLSAILTSHLNGLGVVGRSANASRMNTYRAEGIVTLKKVPQSKKTASENPQE